MLRFLHIVLSVDSLHSQLLHLFYEVCGVLVSRNNIYRYVVTLFFIPTTRHEFPTVVLGVGISQSDSDSCHIT